MSRDSSRPIMVTFFRKDRSILNPIWIRHYAKLDNAIARLSRYAYSEGSPGDLFELSHAVTGMWLGAVRVRVRGLEAEWAWDSPVAEAGKAIARSRRVPARSEL